MNAYLPSRKVIAAGLVAVVTTVLFITGHADVDAVKAAWGTVAAAYAVSN